jgi:sec-independent protein translocase protein TatA
MGAGPWQLAVIALLLLVFFGRSRLGEIGRGLGRGLRALRESVKARDGEAGDDDDTDDDTDEPALPRRRAGKGETGVRSRRHVMAKPREPDSEADD